MQKATYSWYLYQIAALSSWPPPVGHKAWSLLQTSPGLFLSPQKGRHTWCSSTWTSPSAAKTPPRSTCQELVALRRTTAAPRTRRQAPRSPSPITSTSTCPTVSLKVDTSVHWQRSPCRRVRARFNGIIELAESSSDRKWKSVLLFLLGSLLIIILSVVAALLMIFITLLVVVCIIIRYVLKPFYLQFYCGWTA